MARLWCNRWLGLLGALWLAGCGSDAETAPVDGPPDGGGGAAPEACPLGELVHPAGGCCPAGTSANEAGGCCPAGTLPLDDGSCLPAGIPEEHCAEGFEPDGAQGCAPILPATSCPTGLMAVPGDTACREVAPCGDGPWGNIPIEQDSQHVDAAYGGGDSDGSAARPWTSIQDGIGAAVSGAIVAVAAGSYVEDVAISSKAVRLWGRCPSMVEIVGSGEATAALIVGSQPGGTEARSLAITGPGWGIGAASGAPAMVLDQLWVHDTGGPGIMLTEQNGPATVTLSGSLIERTRVVGLHIQSVDATVEGTVVRGVLPTNPSEQSAGADAQPGSNSDHRPVVTFRACVIENNQHLGLFLGAADVTVERSVVRGTQPNLDGTSGRGLDIEPGRAGGGRPTVVLRDSLITDNHDMAVFVGSSDLLFERMVVRDTAPIASEDSTGRGLNVQAGSAYSDERASAIVRESVLDGNAGLGLLIGGSDATIERTVVRNTRPDEEGDGGRGISIQADWLTYARAAVTVRASLVEGNHSIGIRTGGADTLVEGTLVRDTYPSADGTWGFGVDLIAEEEDALRATLILRSSMVERSHGMGLIVSGADAIIQGSVVRDTVPEDVISGPLGRGVNVQPDDPLTLPATLVLRDSVIENNQLFGLYVWGANTVMERSVLRDTMTAPVLGFGDGIIAVTPSGLSEEFPASIQLRRSMVAGSARAGIASFGATITLQGVDLECNTLHLNGEAQYESRGVPTSQPFTFVDEGDNACRCDEQTEECVVLTSGLEAPEPVDAHH